LCLLVALALAGCATQQAMTVSTTIASPSPKYRNAIAVRSVTGGQMMNALTMPGVTDEPFKNALVSTLATNGYFAQPGAASKFYLDAEIQNLEQPLIGLDLEVTANVTYKVSGAGKVDVYPVKAKGSASFSDSPMAADRLRIANERAMQQNIKQFMEGLR
jgi:hypothetical protein